MPDFGSLFGELARFAGPLAGRAFMAFARTTAGMILLAALTAGGSFLIARGPFWWTGGLAVAVALVSFTAVGAMVALKQAVGAAVLEAIQRLGIARKVSGVFFQRVLQVRADDAHGERGRALARAAERLPLREAEARLRRAAHWVVGEGKGDRGAGAWLRRRILGSLVEKIELITLAQCRKAEHTSGGVDLVAVEQQVGQTLDAKVAELVRGLLTKTTVIACLTVVGGSLLAAFLLRLVGQSLARSF